MDMNDQIDPDATLEETTSFLKTEVDADIDVDIDNDIDIEDYKNTPKFWSSKKLIVAGALSLAFIGATFHKTTTTYLSNLLSIDDDIEEELIHTNEYERTAKRQIGNGVYTYDHLVSTHKETLFSLKTKMGAKWYVVPFHETEYVFIDEGEEFLYTFTEVGDYNVKVVREDGNEFSFDISSRVTRQDIRELTTEDANKYFETLQKYYSIGEKEGLALYGTTYVSWSAIVRMHLYGAGTKECDHWHDDAGMINHHVGITFIFEQSIRLITPTVAAHYWDYTREFSDGTEWYESLMFNDDWFGANSPSNDDHIVDTGRWAYSSIMSDARDYSGIVNPYGLLRSPWNTNPTPYLLRFDTTFTVYADGFENFPTCTAFADYVGENYGVISSAVNGFLHGPVHIMVGGHFNEKALWDKGRESTWPSYGDNHLLLSKFMWRQGWIRTPDSCSSDTPADECMPSCPSEIIGDMSATEVLDASRMLEADMGWSTPLQNTLNVDDDQGGTEWLSHEDLLTELCHVGYAGEMFTSAAPQDPLFWPLHGNAERYMYALQYYSSQDVIDFDTTWNFEHDGSSSDTHLVCDWHDVDTITDMPHCDKGTCSGHKEDDLLPFTNLYMVDGLQSNYYTNGEFAEVLRFDNKNLPYVYDSVTYWSACYKQNLIDESELSTTSTEDKLARLEGMGGMRRRLNARLKKQ